MSGLSIPIAARELGTGYQRLYNEVIAGKVKAHRNKNDSGWELEDELPEIAQALGIEYPRSNNAA